MLIERNFDFIINHTSIFPLIKNQNQMSIPAASFHAYSDENKNRKDNREKRRFATVISKTVHEG
jgi:hypothetical protein